MKKAIFLTVLMVFVLALFSGCATMPQTWPDYERSAENKMVVIQEKIGDGLKTGALTPDQSQMFLTTLKGIRTDYTELRDKRVYRDEWDRLNGRLDALGEEINRALARPARIEEPRNGDRIVALQRRIDDGRISGRLPSTEGREFQSRLDSIRRDYLRMTEGGRSHHVRGESRHFPQARCIGNGSKSVSVDAMYRPPLGHFVCAGNAYSRREKRRNRDIARRDELVTQTLILKEEYHEIEH